MGQTADELRRELNSKRQELSQDVDQIQDRVRSTFDLNRQVDERPLLMTGLAVAGGFLLGSMMGGGKKQGHGYDSSEQRWRQARNYPAGSDAPSSSIYSRPMANPTPETEHSEGGLISGLTSNVTSGMSEGLRRGTGGHSFDDLLSSVSATMVALLVDKARDMLETNIPGFTEKYEQVTRSSGDDAAPSPRPAMTESWMGDRSADPSSISARTSGPAPSNTPTPPSSVMQQ